MWSFLRKSFVSIETQLCELEKTGVVPNPEVTDDDLASFCEVSEYEAAPYRKIIEVLGCQIQRKPFNPMCDRLWLCDYECIDDNSAFRKILERLQVLSRRRLHIANIEDVVDLEDSKAWVEFTVENKRVNWDVKVNDDWLDPYIIVKFDELLRQKSDLMIYSNHTDFGQSALFACMTESEFAVFRKLSQVKFDELRNLA